MKKNLLFCLVIIAALFATVIASGATRTYRYEDTVSTIRGDVVGGAIVTVYDAGTTTLATIYSGVTTASSAKANPTYTDVYGRFFFYAPQGRYDVYISGANLTAYTHEDIDLSPYDGMSGVFNVAEYGAKGDGSTDDTDEIQAAVDAAEANGGGTVFFPPATYEVDGTLITIQSDNITLSGYGATLAFGEATFDTNAYFIGTRQDVAYSAGNTVYDNVTIEGLTFDGSIDSVTTSHSASGIQAHQVTNWTIRDCVIKDLPGETGALYGISVWYSSDVNISNVKINRTDRQNIAIWESLDVTIDNCHLTDSFYRGNILVSSADPATLQSSHAVISGCTLLNDLTGGSGANRGIRFAAQGGGVVENTTIGAVNEGIYLVGDYARDIALTNCKIDTCTFGVYADIDAAANILMTGLDISDCTDGIQITDLQGRVAFTGGSITGSTGEPIYYTACDNGVISGSLFDGGSNCTVAPVTNGHNSFVGNTVTNMTGASYSFFANGSGGGTVTYTGNELFGNTNDRPYLTAFGEVIVKVTATPESSILAQLGAIAVNTGGGAGTTLYVKETGTGSTGWVGK